VTNPNKCGRAQKGLATPHHRLNFSYEFSDPKLAADMHLDHQSQAKIFGNGGTVAQVPATPVKKYQYKDGTITVINMGDFSGTRPNERFNPNTYIIDTLKDAIYTFKIKNKITLDPNYDRPPVDGKAVTIRRLQMMAYVFTDKDLLEAFNRFFVLKTGAKGTFHFEQQFADMDGPGFAALFGGFVLNREMGGIMEDVEGILSNNPNIQTTVNQRWIEGTSAPYLNHGKFIVIEGIHAGEDFVEVHDLSENISGHTANAENRMVVRAKAITKFARESVDRLAKIIALDKAKGFALDIRAGEFRDFLSRLTGKDLQNIDGTEAGALFVLINSAQNKSPSDTAKIYAEFISRVQALYNTQSKTNIPLAAFNDRLKSIEGFTNFVIKDQTTANAKAIRGLTGQQFTAGVDSIAYKNENLLERRGDLRFALADKPIKNMTLGELTALDAKIDAAAKAEGQSEPLPPIPLQQAIKEISNKDAPSSPPSVTATNCTKKLKELPRKKLQKPTKKK
jgi:hypothetical protein